MVPCVNSGDDFIPHIKEVIKLVNELAVTTIEKATKGERDCAYFYPAMDHICVHVGPILLVLIGRDALGGYSPTERIDAECERLIDLAHFGVFS